MDFYSIFVLFCLFFQGILHILNGLEAGKKLSHIFFTLLPLASRELSPSDLVDWSGIDTGSIMCKLQT